MPQLALGEYALWFLVITWGFLLLLGGVKAIAWWRRRQAAQNLEPEETPAVQPRDGGPRPTLPRRWWHTR